MRIGIGERAIRARRSQADMERTYRQGPLIPRWFIVAVVLIAFVPTLTLFLNHSAVRG